jgi:hypothetical protein
MSTGRESVQIGDDTFFEAPETQRQITDERLSSPLPPEASATVSSPSGRTLSTSLVSDRPVWSSYIPSTSVTISIAAVAAAAGAVYYLTRADPDIDTAASCASSVNDTLGSYAASLARVWNKSGVSDMTSQAGSTISSWASKAGATGSDWLSRNTTAAWNTSVAYASEAGPVIAGTVQARGSQAIEAVSSFVSAASKSAAASDRWLDWRY